LGITKYVHQVGYRSALITAHIRHSGLQETLGHREDSLAMELITVAEA
jgi:hypothetical protein